MAIPVQIINGTFSIVEQPPHDSLFTIILALSTLGLAIITGIGLWKTHKSTRNSNSELQISNKLTRESNEILKIELRSKMRPLLAFVRTQASVQGNDREIKVRLILTMANSGTVPARKIYAYYSETNNDKIEYLIKEKEGIRNRGFPIGTIQQGGHYDFFIDIPWTHDKQSTKLVMWLEYRYLDQKDEAVVLFHVVGGAEPVPHQWYVKDDIVEAENEWNDIKSGKRSAPH